MTRKQGATLALVVGLALFGGSIAWAATIGHNGTSHHAYAYGPAMMGLGYSTKSAAPVTGIDDARRHAQAFADRLGLKTEEVIRFTRNYYVKLVDKDGNGATEALVDPSTGATSLEYGPAMMWNTKYGMMSGRLGSGMMGTSAVHSMMGGYGVGYGGMMGNSSGGMMGGAAPRGMMGGSSSGPTLPPGGSTNAGHLSAEQATAAAKRWLDAREPGTSAGKAEAFPGYYTFDTTRGGKIAGMISVNEATGAVWPHWWHGAYVESAG